MLTDERERLRNRATAKKEIAADGRKKCSNDDTALHRINIFVSREQAGQFLRTIIFSKPAALAVHPGRSPWLFQGFPGG